ncbi:MAG TPA: hypothetical protein DEB39_08435 [Planctomycetaceae bacterium]|nr:hypothetical protein [Planctomycetaceae bacterium]
MTHFLYAIPLVLAFSFCYAGTRHEEMPAVARHAVHFAGWTVFFMVFVVLIVETIVRFVKV